MTKSGRPSRAVRLSVFSVSLMVSALSQAGRAQAEELPVRQAGLWQLTTIADSVGMKTFQTCIGSNDVIINGVGEKGCGTPDVKRISGEVFVNISCVSQSGQQRTSSLLTGDYSTWYRAVSKITLDPPQGGLDHLGVIVDGKYLGPKCDAAKSAALRGGGAAR